MMAQPFAPPGIPSGNQPYAYQPQLLQRQREAQAMHPLSAAMAAGQPPSQAISDSHQQMQGMGGPGMPNAAGMPGAIPGAVGAGGPVGIPRSVGGGMMGPGQMGPNDQRAMSGQPGAGDVHPMGTGAHMNPHAQAMLQAQGHGMPPGYHNGTFFFFFSPPTLFICFSLCASFLVCLVSCILVVACSFYLLCFLFLFIRREVRGKYYIGLQDALAMLPLKSIDSKDPQSF